MASHQHPTGLFLALEGGEGAGKSTQAELLAGWLRQQGHDVLVTREPGDSAVGARLRGILLDPGLDVTPRAEALLYAADRAEHVAHVVRPALARGAVVISDRYADSSVAYQGYGRGLGAETIRDLSRWATDDLRPDLTLLLDLPAADGLARARRRGAETEAATDRIEAETLEFHERLRTGFHRLAAADPDRYAVLDAAGSPEQVAAAVRAAVATVLAPEPGTGTAAELQQQDAG